LNEANTRKIQKKVTTGRKRGRPMKKQFTNSCDEDTEMNDMTLDTLFYEDDNKMNIKEIQLFSYFFKLKTILLCIKQLNTVKMFSNTRHKEGAFFNSFTPLAIAKKKKKKFTQT